MPIPFDSQKVFYRSPFGAVEQGTEIRFRILLPRTERSKYTELCIKYDYDYNWEYHKLIWCGNFDDVTEIWEVDFTPDRVGLYWYSFRLQTPTRSALSRILPEEAGRSPATARAFRLRTGLSAA